MKYEVKLVCASASTMRTRLPCSASAPAVLTVSVVLPTPPLKLYTAMIFGFFCEVSHDVTDGASAGFIRVPATLKPCCLFLIISSLSAGAVKIRASSSCTGMLRNDAELSPRVCGILFSRRALARP